MHLYCLLLQCFNNKCRLMQKIIAHPQIGDILYVKRIGSRSIRVSVSARKGVRVSLPFWVTYGKAQQFVETNLDKILRVLERQMHSGAAQKGLYSAEELSDIRRRAKEYLPARLAYWAGILNEKISSSASGSTSSDRSFDYSRVFIKNNRTNWGSCSAKRNINLNMHLVDLPGELSDFVIIHELCHLVHRNHVKEFHKLVNSFCGGREKELSASLRKYSHLLRRIP